MRDISLKCGYGGTMDTIDVEYDAGDVRGIMYLVPSRSQTQNGSVEVRKKGTETYLSCGAPYEFEIRAETDDGLKTIKAPLITREPRLTCVRSGGTLTFRVYNTRHFYLNRGIGRIDADKNNVRSEGADFYYDVTYKLPAGFPDKNIKLKAVCLPVVINGKASKPYFIEV